MIIDCISDLHGNYPKLKGGDLLIVAGDLTARDYHSQHIAFQQWLEKQDYERKIVIAGNHDNYLFDLKNCLEIDGLEGQNCHYLEDTEYFAGCYKVWGSPWTSVFENQSLRCMAFALPAGKTLKRKWDLIPKDTDILVTHCPPYGIMDKTGGKSVGCPHLLEAVERIKPKLHVFGHIHEQHGRVTIGDTIFVNASIVDENYDHVDAPVRIILN